jgi:hypothetical protein
MNFTLQGKSLEKSPAVRRMDVDFALFGIAAEDLLKLLLILLVSVW